MVLNVNDGGKDWKILMENPIEIGNTVKNFLMRSISKETWNIRHPEIITIDQDSEIICGNFDVKK